jgi:adenosine deaminase CECR1
MLILIDYRSRLSHDFYQTMAGKADMTLHGWRQLIEWSIEHSCMEDKLKAEVLQSWEESWDVFCNWIVKEYGSDLKETNTDSSGL